MWTPTAIGSRVLARRGRTEDFVAMFKFFAYFIAGLTLLVIMVASVERALY